MATMDLARGRRGPWPAWHGILQRLRARIAALRRQREERRARAAIRRLGPRLMRDIGLDPEQVSGGGWDGALRVNRALLPRDRPL